MKQASPALASRRPIDLERAGGGTGVWSPQGMWAGAWRPPGQPLALCNYDRFNDLEPRPVKVSVVDQKTVVPADFDPYGHYWRPFTFPRPYAVYTGPPRSDTRLWHP